LVVCAAKAILKKSLVNRKKEKEMRNEKIDIATKAPKHKETQREFSEP
jgi:hypothetical protein